MQIGEPSVGKGIAAKTAGQERLIWHSRPLGIARWPIRQGRFVLRWASLMADRLSDRMAAWLTDFLTGRLSS